MKRRLTVGWFIVLLLLLPALGWSQTSLLSDVSFGLFENPLDAAFSVADAGISPHFSALGRSFFFTGLTNIPWNAATSTNSEPLSLGYYHKAPMPWSVSTDIWLSTVRSIFLNGATVTTTTKPVGATNNTWITTSTDNQYDCLASWNQSVGGQFLIGLGFMNVGLAGTWEYQTNVAGVPINTWAADNRVETYTVFYDTAAPGVAPAPATNYTRTTTYVAPDATSTIAVQVPFFMKLGSLGLAAEAQIVAQSRDASSSRTTAYTAPAAAGAGTFNNVVLRDSIDDRGGAFYAGLDASLYLPSLFAGHPENHLVVGVLGGLLLYHAKPYVETYIEQDYSYAGGGAALQPAWDGTDPEDTVTTDTRKGNAGGLIVLSAQQFFYFDLAESLRLGFAPRISAGPTIIPDSNYRLTRRVVVTKDDGNNNGTFTDAADTITTTTTTYEGNNARTDADIAFRASLPAALRFRPSGWPFGVTLGNRVEVSATVRYTWDYTQSTRVVEEVASGDDPDTVDTTTTTTEVPGNKVTSTTMSWAFDDDWKLGLTVYLPADITLDVILNSSNLFQFDNLSVQAVIPLP